MAFYDSYNRFGEQLAFVDDRGHRITYAEAFDFARGLGERLKTRSIAFCLCENSAGSGLGYLSFLNNKVVPLLLDRKIDSDLLSHLIEVYKPRYLYYPSDWNGVEGYDNIINQAYDYTLAECVDAPDIPLHEELGLLLTTSGSTGSPKLVRQTYHNIQSNAEAIANMLKLDQSERPITTLPMNYTYGLSVLASHLQAGATILFTEQSILMKAFWDFLKRERATSFTGVPFTYELLKKVRFFKMDLPDLRYMSQSGGKLNPAMHEEFALWCREHGKAFLAMYGATEATARMAWLPAEYSVEKYGSVGKAIPGSRFVLLEVDGNESTEPIREGDLVFCGEGVTLGYAICPEDLCKDDEWHGSLHTGDIAICDEDGFYYIVGRIKRFLKIFGNRVNLDEIDRLIKAKFEDLDCASTGIDDHMKTYITNPQRMDAVRQYLSTTTHLSESAFEVRYLPEIPKNNSGKVLFNELPQV